MFNVIECSPSLAQEPGQPDFASKYENAPPPGYSPMGGGPMNSRGGPRGGGGGGPRGGRGGGRGVPRGRGRGGPSQGR